MGRYYDNVRAAFVRVISEMLPFEMGYFGRVDYGVVREESEPEKSFIKRLWLAFVKREYGMTPEELESQSGAEKPLVGIERKNKLAELKKPPEQREFDAMVASNPCRPKTMAAAVWHALCILTKEHPEGVPFPDVARKAGVVSRTWSLDLIDRNKKQTLEIWRVKLAQVVKECRLAQDEHRCCFYVRSDRAPELGNNTRRYRLERIIHEV